MFKKVIFTSALLLLMVSQASAAGSKIAVFDEGLVSAKVPQFEAVGEKVKKKFSDRITELKALGEKFVAKQEDAQRNAMTMTEAQGIKLKRELTDMNQNLKTKEKNLKEDFQRAQQKEVMKIREKIHKAVTKIAKKEKFDLVIRKEAVAYRKDAIDISEQIIDILSKPAG